MGKIKSQDEIVFTLTEELITQNEKGDVEIIVPEEESCPKL